MDELEQAEPPAVQESLLPEVVIPEPEDVKQGDLSDMVAKKHLPMLNGILKACHVSFAQVTTLKGLGQAIDNTLKVMKAQRQTVGLTNGTISNSPRGNPVPTIPD